MCCGSTLACTPPDAAISGSPEFRSALRTCTASRGDGQRRAKWKGGWCVRRGDALAWVSPDRGRGGPALARAASPGLDWTDDVGAQLRVSATDSRGRIRRRGFPIPVVLRSSDIPHPSDRPSEVAVREIRMCRTLMRAVCSRSALREGSFWIDLRVYAWLESRPRRPTVQSGAVSGRGSDAVRRWALGVGRWAVAFSPTSSGHG